MVKMVILLLLIIIVLILSLIFLNNEKLGDRKPILITDITEAETARCSLSQYLTNLMHKICFTISFSSCFYVFRAHVLIIRRSRLHYTASGIITPIGVHQVG